MSSTQLAFNSDDLAFQESRQDPTVVATRVVSLNAVWPATATFPSTRLHVQVTAVSGARITSVLPTIRELSPSGSNRGSVTAVSRSVDGFPSFPGDERHKGQGRDRVCPRRVKDQVCQQSCQSDQ